MIDKKLDSWIQKPFDASLPFLEQIPRDVQNLLLEKAQIREYDEGDLILRRGNVSEEFFVVQVGQVKECGKKHEGKYLEEYELPKGACFGEASVLSGIPMSRTYIAAGFCTMLVMDKSTFLEFVIERPGVMVVMYRMLADAIDRRTKSLDNLLKPGVQGSLSTQSFMDIAQSFGNSMKTGIVSMDYNGVKAVVGFNEGQMVYAKSSTGAGEEVLDQIMTWEEGNFSYEHTEPIQETNIQGDTMGLLLDALRRIDEAANEGGGDFELF